MNPPPPPKKCLSVADLFLSRFQEGISFPSVFEESSILRLPLSKRCAVPFAPQNRALFDKGKGRQGAEKQGGRGVASKRGKKEKRTRENRSEFVNDLCNVAPHTGSPGPFGPENPGRVRKESRKSTPGQGPKSPERVRPGVPKESEKSPKVRF